MDKDVQEQRNAHKERNERRKRKIQKVDEIQEKKNLQFEGKLQERKTIQRNRGSCLRWGFKRVQRFYERLAALTNAYIARTIIGVVMVVCFLLICTGFTILIEYFTAIYSPAKPRPVLYNKRYPIIAWATPSYVSYPLGDTLKCFHEGKYLECEFVSNDYTLGSVDAYFYYATFFKNLPLPRDTSVLWAMIHEESPRNNLKLMNERGLNLFNFSATYSTNSDVPMPLINMQKLEYITEMKFFVKTSVKNKYLSEIAPVMYLQTNCGTSTKRDDYVTELMKYIKVDSYGACLHNKELPLPKEFQHTTKKREYLRRLERDEFLKFLAKYKFVIAIENGVCYDYISEKLWRPLRLGVVPIYLGAGNVRDWLPHPRAALLLEDLPTPAIMAARLHQLNKNDTLYELHLDHKIHQRILNRRLVEEAETHSYQFDFRKVVIRLACKVCERLHENSTRVNMVTKKHYNCPEPISAVTLAVNPDNEWRVAGRIEENNVEDLYSRIYEQRNTKNNTPLLYGFSNFPSEVFH